MAGPVAARLRDRQLDPTPRLAAGQALAAASARALIDLSDGLGGDARHLAEAGGIAIAIDADALPLAPGVTEVAAAAGRDPLELAVAGGEDYELLAALPPGRWPKPKPGSAKPGKRHWPASVRSGRAGASRSGGPAGGFWRWGGMTS